MDLHLARNHASRVAKQATGDFYPGPVLMPHAVLRAMEPVLAFALGPALSGEPELAQALEQTLRGNPRGPLMTALWASSTTGEIQHDDLRAMVRLFPADLPDRPASRGDLVSWLLPRVGVLTRSLLAVAGHKTDPPRAPAERLGLGVALTAMLAGLGHSLEHGFLPLPLSDLRKANCSEEELLDRVRTPAVDRLLATEARWAQGCLDEGLGLRRHLGARLRRGVRAVVVRSRHILDRVEDPRHDIFRHPPHLRIRERWQCAARAMAGVRPGPNAPLSS